MRSISNMTSHNISHLMSYFSFRTNSPCNQQPDSPAALSIASWGDWLIEGGGEIKRCLSCFDWPIFTNFCSPIFFHQLLFPEIFTEDWDSVTRKWCLKNDILRSQFSHPHKNIPKKGTWKSLTLEKGQIIIWTKPPWLWVGSRCNFG